MKFLEKIYEFAGFYVDSEGCIHTTTYFAIFICELCVLENSFLKVCKNNYKLNKYA